jgi:hypothetical protein
MTMTGVNPSAIPTGTGCAECDEAGGWWFHLRRCATCGHIGCCDSSPAQHATAHWRSTGHPVVQTFEPDEDWMWDYQAGQYVEGPQLAQPVSRPREQPAPGPEGRVPADWRRHLH